MTHCIVKKEALKSLELLWHQYDPYESKSNINLCNSFVMSILFKQSAMP